MSKHARPTRAALIARTGARSGAALAIGTVALTVGAAPAIADGTPPQIDSADNDHDDRDKHDDRDTKVVNKKKVVKKKTINNITYKFESDPGGDITNSNGLVNIADNNVQALLQACNNFVPVNVGGLQGAGEELTGALGFGDGDTTAEADNADDCDQGAAQQDGDNTADGDDDHDADFAAQGGGGQDINNSNGLVNIADNNVQIPLQACNNFVPVNVAGIQIAIEEATGAAGFGDGDTTADADNADDCDQESGQQDGDNVQGNGGGANGEINNSNGLVNIANNNVQIPLQACNNDVPVNVLGGQFAGSELTGAFGMGDDDSETTADADNSDDCDQGSAQQDGDNVIGDDD